jgi:parvulin-like peptidyl-prolyl isomerase
MKTFLLSLICISLLSVSTYAEDTIVAKVNGTALTMRDLEAQVDRMIPQITFHRQVSPENRKNYYNQALEELINRELEYQDAVAKGMKAEKEDVDAQLQKIKAKFKSEEDFKAALDKQGLTDDSFRLGIGKELLIKSILKKTVTEPSQISEAILKEFYDKHITEFKKPESVRLRVLSTKDEKKASEMLEKLKAGEDMAQLLANTMSEDTFKSKGGDIGYVHKGRMNPEIDKVAFSLKTGDFSTPIHVEDTWYIIKVEDKKPEYTVSFDDTKRKLEQELETEKALELQKKWIDSLKSKAKIEILLKQEQPQEKKEPPVTQ